MNSSVYRLLEGEFSVHLDSPEEDVARTPITYGGPGEIAPVTVSVGLAQLSGETTCDAFVESADGALYRAKQGGRNRVAE